MERPRRGGHDGRVEGQGQSVGKMSSAGGGGEADGEMFVLL